MVGGDARAKRGGGGTTPVTMGASEASEPTSATAAKRPAVTITSCVPSPEKGYIDFKWDPLDAPEDHRAWAEDCFEKWSREELDDLLREHRARRLGDPRSIPHHQAREYYGALNPDFDALCTLFTDVCTAIAQYAAANEI